MNGNSEVLYLTKDKHYLTDGRGNIIAIKEMEDGKDYYRPISIESEAYEKKCIQVAPRKVCVLWGEDFNCLAWDEVDICTRWELTPRGFSNIS